jgi:hypothetical protein
MPFQSPFYTLSKKGFLMGIIRVYADTSVFGGLFDEEFKAPTQTFFDSLKVFWSQGSTAQGETCGA